MADVDRSLTLDEEAMARDLCALVTSWNAECTMARARELVDSIWTEDTARVWFKVAKTLRDDQTQRMVEAVEDEGLASVSRTPDASGASRRGDFAYTLKKRFHKTSSALGGLFFGAATFGIATFLLPRGAFRDVSSIVVGAVSGLIGGVVLYRLWVKEIAAEQARDIKDSFD